MMKVQKTLNAKQVKQLYAASIANPKSQGYYIAKDYGAYVGAGILSEGGVVFYFEGCNPEKDSDYYEESRYKFGGDDFAENFNSTDDIALLKRCADENRIMRFIVTKTKIEILHRPA